MSFETASRSAEKRLQDNWAATPVAWDNKAFKQPRGTPWIRYQMSWGGALQIAIKTSRESGVIMIGVFTPKGDGPRPNHSLCDTIAALYRNWQEGYLFCEAPYVERVGEDEEWFHQNVVIPFYYDNCFEEVV